MKLPNKKTFFAVTLLALIVFGTSPLFAHAGSGWMGLPTVTDMVTGGFKLVAYIFNFIGGLAFTFANYLVKFALYDLNFKLMDAQNAIVHVGWGIARDVANLGFVLTIVIIAFTTIVRVESYGAKKLLPKLIAAAIIVNFSLGIAGVFIDFSNIVTSFFLEKSGASGGNAAGLGEAGITARLANAFGPQRFLTPPEDPLPPNPEEEMGLFSEIGTAFLTSIASLAFIVIFTLIATIVLLALAAMLIVRYVQLSLLIVASPLVWLFWVFPGLGSLYTKWWDNFIHWVFFAPAVSFCLYITLISIDGISNIKGSSAFFSAGIMGTIVNQGAQMVVVSFMLILGLIAAEKMGISGAAAFKGAAMGVVTGAKNIAKGQAMRLTQGRAGALAAGATTKAGTFMGTLGKGLQIKPGDKLLTRLGKRAANVVTGASGLRMNASAIGGALEATGRGITKAAKTKPRSIGNTMFSAIKGGYKGKEEKPEEEKKTPEEKAEELREAIEKLRTFKESGADTAELVLALQELSKNISDVDQLETIRNEVGSAGIANAAFGADEHTAFTKDLDKRISEKTKGAWEKAPSVADLETQRATLEARAAANPTMTVYPNLIKDINKEIAKKTKEEWEKIDSVSGLETERAGLERKVAANPTHAAVYQDLIASVENEIKKTAKEEMDDQPDASSLRSYRSEIQTKHDQAIQRGADPEVFKEVLSRVDKEVKRIGDIEAKQPAALKAWETQIKSLEAGREADIRSGAFVPTPGAIHPNDALINEGRRQTAVWQNIGAQKPKTKLQWNDRVTALTDALAKATSQHLPPDAISKIRDLLTDATTEFNNKP
ncbi:MAG: hypothetical protein WCW78_01330 [Candidatus Paceibacterota bacterium]|jgi:hypothetical protein